MSTIDVTTNIIKEEYPAPIRSKNGSFARWYDGFLPGTIFGVIFLFFLFATVSVEVARIFTGSLNRATGSNNFYQLYPNNIYSLPSTTFNVGISSFATNANFERQHHYLWPWSHPSLFFAIPLLFAATFGFSSGRRGTYSTIYLFFLFSLITFIIMPFIIAYFAVNVARHNLGYSTAGYDSNANRDKTLSIVMLILSCLLLIVAFAATIVGGLGYNCCIPKGGAFLSPIRRAGPFGVLQ